MGCNCGKSNGNVVYKATFVDGSSSVFRTEVEAKAATIRKGGGAVTAQPK